MADDSKPQSWAKLKDAQARERQLGKLARLRAQIGEERSTDLRDRVGAGANGDVDARVQAIIEGDVHTHSPLIQQVENRRDALRIEQANLITELELLRPQYVRACKERNEHIRNTTEWAQHNFGSRLPDSHGSTWTLVLAILGLVILESVMLRRPAESTIRTLFPEWGSVTFPALLLVAMVTLLSALVLAFTGRSWKEFNVATARAKIAEDSGHESLVPKPSPYAMLIWTGVALASQTILMILRIQVDTGDSSARGALIMFSVLLLFLAVAIVLIEYRIHTPKTRVDVTWDETSIATFLGMWTRAYTHIPRELASLGRQRLGVIKSAVHEQQRVAPRIDDGGVILQSLNRYVADLDQKLSEIKDPDVHALPGEDGLPPEGASTDGAPD